MNNNKEWEQLRKEYNNIKVPENGFSGMRASIERAKKEKERRKKILVFKRTGISMAAAVMLAILIPNMNAGIAMAMEKIPVIGSIVRVVTFGRYDFEDDSHDAKVEIPQVEIETPDKQEEITNTEYSADTQTGNIKESADSINKDIEDYINPIVDEFKKSIEEEYHKALDITYEVVTDTENWFTLRIDVLEIEASGYQYSKYYHIDKVTGERAELKDIFKTDADYITVISENIKIQMREQMAADEGKMYFIDIEDIPVENFDKINENQNFYFNTNGELVIAFDEYEAAPGYMGAVQFTIPKEVTDDLLK